MYTPKDSDNYSLIIAALFSVTLLLIFFILDLYAFPVSQEFLTTHIDLLNMESTLYQKLIFIATLSIFSLLSIVTFLKKDFGLFLFKDRIIYSLISLLVILALLMGKWHKMQLIGMALIFVFYVAYYKSLTIREIIHKLIHFIVSSKVALTVVLLLLALLWIVPLFFHFHVHDFSSLLWIDGHYAVTVLSGLDLVHGNTVQNVNYGISMPILTASYLYLLSIFDYSKYGLVDAVKFYQLVAIVIIGLILYIKEGKNIAIPLLLIIGLTAYTTANTGIAIGYPNQSGIRYIPLIIGLLLFAVEMKNKIPRTWVLAFISSFCTVMNPETGFALTLGLLFASMLVAYKDKGRLDYYNVVITFILFAVCYTALFFLMQYFIVNPLMNKSTESIFNFLLIFGGASGYGGMSDKISINALMFFFVATFILTRTVFQLKNKKLTVDTIWQASIAVILLVWLYYYINRMAEWNLWFHWVLLVLLLSPYLTYGNLLKMISNKFDKKTKMLFCCISLFLAGQTAYSARLTMESTLKSYKLAYVGCDESNFFGVFYVDNFNDSRLKNQFNELLKFEREKTTVLSAFSTNIRLLGFNEEFPWNTTMDIIYKKDLSLIPKWLDDFGTEFIIIDAPSSTTAQVSQKHLEQTNLMLQQLTSYQKVTQTNDWVVYERNH